MENTRIKTYGLGVAGAVVGYFMSYLFQNPMMRIFVGVVDYVLDPVWIFTTAELVWPAVLCVLLGAGIGLGLAFRK